jgi:hypothetical protein
METMIPDFGLRNHPAEARRTFTPADAWLALRQDFVPQSRAQWLDALGVEHAIKRDSMGTI